MSFGVRITGGPGAVRSHLYSWDDTAVVPPVRQGKRIKPENGVSCSGTRNVFRNHRFRVKNGRANHDFPGSTPVSGVVFGVPPKKRVGGTPTRTRETRVLPSKRASCGEDYVFAREGISMRLP